MLPYSVTAVYIHTHTHPPTHHHHHAFPPTALGQHPEREAPAFPVGKKVQKAANTSRGLYQRWCELLQETEVAVSKSSTGPPMSSPSFGALNRTWRRLDILPG
uniref:Uncharacterized protein n=1 Tax=Vombatus ursinus TaxID=29139 RepID=A0A4X2KWJ1_VOMUR